MKKIFFILFSLILLLLFGCKSITTQTNKSLNKTFNNTIECYSAEDCVKIQVTCCPCNMGGKEKCVPRDKVNLYKDKLKQCPKDLTCIALFNCKNFECKCENNKCIEK